MDSDFNLHSYIYELPEDRIAQLPVAKRDRSRLLAVDCRNDITRDLLFTDITGFLQPGDLLVVNNTRVFPARLEGRKESGGKIEFFLLEYPDFTSATANFRAGTNSGTTELSLEVNGLLKSSKRPKAGARLLFSSSLEGQVQEFCQDGKVRVKLTFYLSQGQNPEDILSEHGRVPLPPYINRENADHPSDRERYQTLFAEKSGAVAAPTAGLHFSDTLLRQLEEKKIKIAPITLHVGYGTFAPVRVNDIRQHTIHEEYVEVSPETAELVNSTINTGKHIWTVGTTTARTLEFAAAETGQVKAVSGWCGLYIYPGYEFRVVNRLITNFHLPGSSLLFLVAALAGKERILDAYRMAVELKYRFYSYGDAMLIIT